MEFFVSEDQLPRALLPLLVELARSDNREDVADTAAGVVQRAEQSRHADVASQARAGLAAMPVRVNVHPSATTAAKAEDALLQLAHDNVVVAPQQQSQEPATGATELRYFRREDAGAAHKVADSLAKKGINAEVKDWTQRIDHRPMRPKSLDLVFGK
jgi:CO/xanthine dehydrogenase Mo-binding subunit